jgi:hypothetical protein
MIDFRRLTTFTLGVAVIISKTFIMKNFIEESNNKCNDVKDGYGECIDGKSHLYMYGKKTTNFKYCGTSIIETYFVHVACTVKELIRLENISKVVNVLSIVVTTLALAFMNNTITQRLLYSFLLIAKFNGETFAPGSIAFLTIFLAFFFDFFMYVIYQFIKAGYIFLTKKNINDKQIN